MKNYVLASSFGRANVQDRQWYCMESSDLDTMLADDKTSLLFGDKVWVIKEKKLYILGNDYLWYEM